MIDDPQNNHLWIRSVRDCPVCKRPDLTEAMERCPQCGADLECFGLLDSLQEPKSKYARNWFVAVLLSILLLGLVGVGGYFQLRVDRLTTQFNQHITAMGQQIDKLEEENFRKRIEDFDEQRAVAWRRIEASLATYGISVSVDSESKP
uniref:Uncharacterized protein n=1 Tax=Candidatus Kentrum sp. LFY TaxID=2126342 RepID=A0A450WPH9_9GAMM|nr:MAG: hypothetical protein BECKLFY1418C_GA0070996_10517 [Candidatus Kentron sp. LFY]